MGNPWRKSLDPRIGGIIIGILAIFLEYFYSPWGISQGIKYLGDLFWSFTDVIKKPKYSIYWVFNWIIILSAFVSANLFNDFAIRIPSQREFIKGILGGILMGLGAFLAQGGNITGFYSGIANLSGSAILIGLGLFIGIYLGVIYQVKELEKYPVLNEKEARFKKFWFNLVLAILGIIGLIFIIKNNPILLILVGIGIILERSRFCMLNAFRELFFSGESIMSQALILSLALYTLGIAFLKMKGLINPTIYVFPVFGWMAFAGGLIFGIGMILSGCCSASLLWKIGEGYIKTFVVFLFFIISYGFWDFLFYKICKIKTEILIGKKLFLPQYLTYPGGLGLILGICAIWYGIVSWNSKTKKLVKRYF